jgi:hypothetical protein
VIEFGTRKPKIYFARAFSYDIDLRLEHEDDIEREIKGFMLYRSSLPT